ncbi:putative signaling protein [Pseudidiomarina piscicola]|uniref:Putative signaling protein n=1 Tax=Pseudidiomarina piscicola TaxID=2614830 RepID=A0A6S6WPI9_9GAMM|nr:EAL domain-containing protein [Pseudidiomarina piscicola]CAB0151609.1 putative signaling protein [Pseudidiomarina piscicola]VZT41074.1 putative signaling protein [Pseudomonas aeruginosa]
MAANPLEELLKVPDEESESNLDELLESVRRHLNMEVAFLSEITDGKRIFRYVSADSGRQEIPIRGHGDECEKTYCKRILDGVLPPIIRDTQENAITASLPVTEELGIGSYAGVPVYLKDNRVYGTLCCYDSSPAEYLSDRDLGFLHVVAATIGQLMRKKVERDERIAESTHRIKSVAETNNLQLRFQPVVDADNSQVLFYETLARFNSSPYRPPNEWIDEAESVGLGIYIESLILLKALEHLALAEESQLLVKLSLNVSPNLMLNGNLFALLEGIDPNALVLEITEHTEIDDYSVFARKLQPLVDKGLEIAIDDVGSGFASLRHIIELEPDIIKLDMNLIRAIEGDTKRQALVAALVAFAESSEIQTVAEGVETQAELDTLKGLGVSNFQGYFFARPEEFSTIIERAKATSRGG